MRSTRDSCFTREAGRNDLEVPNYDDVLKFFQYQASEAGLVSPIRFSIFPNARFAFVVKMFVFLGLDRLV